MADAWSKTYVLKHKEVAVAEIKLDEATAAISAIGQVYDERHVPVGVPVMLDKSLALSLSDHYWICPVNSDADWSRVNFFDNAFSEDVGNVLLGKAVPEDEPSLMSPDNTADGWVKKK